MSVLVCDAKDALEEFEKVYKTDQDTLEYWLAKIDRSRLRIANARFVLREFQSWYSQEGSDILAYRSEVSAAAYTDFLEEFRRDIGFDFISESGSVRKLALKVLKHGRVSCESDWEILQELRVDVSQTILSKGELAKLSEIMEVYEATL